MDNEVLMIQPSDYDLVIGLVNEWWGGRQMADMLPRLFFKHFNETSLIVKQGQEVLGFLIGFISPQDAKQAYVHFVGVNPSVRKNNIGKRLYVTFFEIVKEQGVERVECVTAPTNHQSIRFHTKLGFTPLKGDACNDIGVPYFKDYDGYQEDRVLFRMMLNKGTVLFN